MKTSVPHLFLTGILLAPVLSVADTHYVSINSTNPVPPYTTWATAANVIQDAVDAASAGDTVLVTNGVYATGGKAIHGAMTNRVALDKPLKLLSINGPESTIIKGFQVPTTTNGDGAVRCVYLATQAVLSGFTLTNGATRADGDWDAERSGGGVWCASTNSWISNCVLRWNSADQRGAGVFGGRLNKCTISENSCEEGGGAALAVLNHCTLTGNRARGGGGAYGSVLASCTVAGNSAWWGGGADGCTLQDCNLINNTGAGVSSIGGGADGGTLVSCRLYGNSAGSGGGAARAGLQDCVLAGNVASDSGGGAYTCELRDCLISGNSAWQGGGSYSGVLWNCRIENNVARQGGGSNSDNRVDCCVIVGNLALDVGGGMNSSDLTGCTVVNNTANLRGGGCFFGTMENCIVLFNTAQFGNDNYAAPDEADFCCMVPPFFTGTGNITNTPLFLNTNGWTNLRLQSNSPCINAGNNAFVTSTNDLDGNPRIVGGTADMGAYEFQSPASSISYAWLQQYGLPTNGSVDDKDGDGDQATTWQEWKMWTIPTNALSVLKILHPTITANGTEVSWQSVDGQSYTLERALTDSTVFEVLQSGMLGQAGTTTFTDTTTTNGSGFLYRVSVPD